MHSIDVTEKWEDEFNESHVSIVIKTLYAIKLHYPEGIEIEIPRTYRSIYKFKFRIDAETRVFSEHWGWLSEAITKKFDYDLVLNHNDSKSSLQVKDDTLIFTVWYDGGAEAYQYLPLEYHRDEAIKMCQQIQAIYERHANKLQFRHRVADILTSSPTQFPVIRLAPGANNAMIQIQYYPNSFSKQTCDVRISDGHAIRTWLETVQHDPNNRSSIQSGQTRLSDTPFGIDFIISGPCWGSSWSMHRSAIPKLIAALA